MPVADYAALRTPCNWQALSKVDRGMVLALLLQRGRRCAR